MQIFATFHFHVLLSKGTGRQTITRSTERKVIGFRINTKENSKLFILAGVKHVLICKHLAWSLEGCDFVIDAFLGQISYFTAVVQPKLQVVSRRRWFHLL